MNPLIIAHRGGKFWEGNCFSYISNSICDGADIIELDVRVRDKKYIVQHMPWDKVQGTLREALKRVKSAKVYLDVKNQIDINELVSYVRSVCANEIIVGSSDVTMLAGINDGRVVRNCHCFLPWTSVSRALRSGADWINPLCYVTTKSLAKKIQDAGFKFVPSGNPIFKRSEIMENQVQYAMWGAYAVSTHHVREMKRRLNVCQQDLT